MVDNQQNCEEEINSFIMCVYKNHSINVCKKIFDIMKICFENINKNDLNK